MASDTYLSVVFPAYNEEARIETVLSTYCDHFANQQIVVVCNGCTDTTPAIVNRLCLKYSQIKTLCFEKKLGKGGAIIEGFKAAEGDRIGFVDADESVEPDDVMRMFDALSKSNVDGLIASRRLKESRILIKQPWKRRAGSIVFNILVRMMFNLDYRDTQCGAKVFTRVAIKNVLDSLITTGFEFDVELLWKLKNRGYKVIEFPITWKHSEGSTFHLSNAPKMFLGLLLLKVRRWK
ncbi:MAG TPA: dolichyl-phosphate beta-glucosyltransferase [Dehalococcoidia bacterium]|nr:dolichyl-phosphate beta-glucosyltransferase [Dehalococcoidia bacterium]